jgi:hypothetical protein
MTRTLLAGALVSTSLLMSTGPAEATSTECTKPTLADPLVGDFENVVVPAGAVCFLRFSTVSGNVLLGAGSKTFIVQSEVAGNVGGTDAEILQLNTAEVGGNLEVVGGSVDDIQPFSFDVAICRGTKIAGNANFSGTTDIVVYSTSACGGNGPNMIGGNFNVSGNHVRVIVRDTNVGGTMSVKDNVVTGEFSIDHNVVTGKLACSGNVAPIVVGGPNTAAKFTGGQCW